MGYLQYVRMVVYPVHHESITKCNVCPRQCGYTSLNLFVSILLPLCCNVCACRVRTCCTVCRLLWGSKRCRLVRVVWKCCLYSCRGIFIFTFLPLLLAFLGLPKQLLLAMRKNFVYDGVTFNMVCNRITCHLCV